MDIRDIVVGETYEAVGAPSSKLLVSGKGDTVVLGYWQNHVEPRQEAFYSPALLRPITKRYEVVEYRLPKVGDLYLDSQLNRRTGGHVRMSWVDFWTTKAFIVKEIV